MSKPDLRELYRLVNTLADGRRVYLTRGGKIQLTTRRAAELCAIQTRALTGIMIDELVYAQDLSFYAFRSYCLERLIPFVRVVDTSIERADAPTDPRAVILGGRPAFEAGICIEPASEMQIIIIR
jgi:hypothetical protein